jgi:hypothetical protein
VLDDQDQVLGRPLHLRSVLKKRELPPGVIAGPTYMSLTVEAACSGPVSCARAKQTLVRNGRGGPFLMMYRLCTA